MLKVSVIVPVYNAEKYLEKCMLSLLEQTMPSDEIEIIAVNDGSKDNSLAILNDFSKKYENLIVVDSSNQGVSSARNKGLKLAKGEYIGFVDSDDYVELNTYETLYNKAKENDADIVFTTMFKNESEKFPAQIKEGLFESDSLTREIYPRLISSLNPSKSTLRGSVCCRLFKGAVIKDNEITFPENLIYNEDGFFSILAALKSERYLSLSESYFYHNRINEDSTTKRYIENLWNIQKEMVKMLENIVEGEGYDFTPQIAKKAFDIAVYSIENEAKSKNQNSKKQRRKNVVNILKDKDLKNQIKNIKVSTLKNIEKCYFIAIKLKMPNLAIKIAKHRYKNNPYF